jgi:hypothetical protein
MLFTTFVKGTLRMLEKGVAPWLDLSRTNFHSCGPPSYTGKPHTSNQTNHKAHTVVLLVNATAYGTTVDNGQLDHTAAAKKSSGFVCRELAEVQLVSQFSRNLNV